MLKTTKKWLEEQFHGLLSWQHPEYKDEMRMQHYAIRERNIVIITTQQGPDPEDDEVGVTIVRKIPKHLSVVEFDPKGALAPKFSLIGTHRKIASIKRTITKLNKHFETADAVKTKIASVETALHQFLREARNE